MTVEELIAERTKVGDDFQAVALKCLFEGNKTSIHTYELHELPYIPCMDWEATKWMNIHTFYGDRCLFIWCKRATEEKQ